MRCVVLERVGRILFPVLAGAMSAVAAAVLVWQYPFAVDVEIPLRAAERWLAGEAVYEASAFAVTGGPELPFLYPPFVLPFVAPLTVVPREAVQVVWLAACVLAALFAGRRLGLAWPWAVAVLIWPPFTEGILGGNVGIVLFAMFAALFWRAGVEVDVARSGRPALVDGGLAAGIAAIKVAQFQPWLFVLRRRPRAALLGLFVFALVALVTLPLVGVGLWTDWLGQAARASDPEWPAVGVPLSTFLGRPVAIVVTVLTGLAALLLPARRAGAWLGILMIVGAPSLHMFQLLFLLPAMLVVRREVAFLAAFFVATYQEPLIWAAVALTAGALWLADRRPAWRAAPGLEAPAVR